MASKFFRGGKFAYEMLVPTVKKNLTKRRKDFEDLVKTTDKYTKNLTKEGQISVKKTVAPAAKKISGIYDKYEKKLGPGSSNPRAKKAGGGMMGRRMGYASGTLKPIPEGNEGLPKLPKKVRNKMGFLKSGGKV